MKRKQDPFPTAKGNAVDSIAFNYGIKRKRYFFIFKESDKSLKKRIVNYIMWGVKDER